MKFKLPLNKRQKRAAQKRAGELYEIACAEARAWGNRSRIAPDEHDFGWKLDKAKNVIFTLNKKPIKSQDAPAWLKHNYLGYLDYNS